MKLPTAEKLLMSLIEQCLICAALLDLWIWRFQLLEDKCRCICLEKCI
jgi:hypothetical protein